MSARTDIYAVAKVYAWKPRLSYQPPTIDTFTKGECWVNVRYDKRGRVTGAAAGTDRHGPLFKVTGKNGLKFQEVVRILSTHLNPPKVAH